MNKILALCLAFTAISLAPEQQTFIKKKKNAPSMTECCDLGVDVLAQSAQAIADLSSLQQKLIRISRDVIDNDKKCYLACANKEQLTQYYEKTEQCKKALDSLSGQIQHYTQYLNELEWVKCN